MSRGQGKNEVPIWNWGLIHKTTGKLYHRIFDERDEARDWLLFEFETLAAKKYRIARLSIREVKRVRDLNLLA